MEIQQFSRKHFLYSMTREERKKFLEKESEENSRNSQECERIYTEGAPLILDLFFTASMSLIEINSMIVQIRLSVGFLRKQYPQFFKIVCVNVSETLKETLSKKGSKSWRVDLYEGDISEIPIVQGKEVIILSPDAEEILENIDLSHQVFVIGGLVDKTVQHKLTFNRGVELGIRTCRLPVKEKLSGIADPYKLKKVLNINTVVEILHKKASGLEWLQCLLSSIPARWIKTSD